MPDVGAPTQPPAPPPTEDLGREVDRLLEETDQAVGRRDSLQPGAPAATGSKPDNDFLSLDDALAEAVDEARADASTNQAPAPAATDPGPSTSEPLPQSPPASTNQPDPAPEAIGDLDAALAEAADEAIDETDPDGAISVEPPLAPAAAQSAMRQPDTAPGNIVPNDADDTTPSARPEARAESASQTSVDPAPKAARATGRDLPSPIERTLARFAALPPKVHQTLGWCAAILVFNAVAVWIIALVKLPTPGPSVIAPTDAAHAAAGVGEPGHEAPGGKGDAHAAKKPARAGESRESKSPPKSPKKTDTHESKPAAKKGAAGASGH
ncbi:MAG: hypothetical protein JNM07_10480 [Phycisphaerae bacterium]|nr:hypothetical protein [Phycisphaerae bacterium]